MVPERENREEWLAEAMLARGASEEYGHPSLAPRANIDESRTLI
jgi:hypothetical protein